MLTLYPSIKPNQTLMLKVDETHEIYVEESGNPEGLPVIFIHGGPGGGCRELDRCFFDPEAYRIILFDQRGAGRSTPHSSLENNTTGHLINDIEKIRAHFSIDKWVVFGGSWGSTLSLAYAQAHPEFVLSLILRGIFLGSDEEAYWLYGSKGCAKIFPDYYKDFHAPLGEEQISDEEIISDYYQLLTSDDEVHRMAAAKAWSIFEGSIATLEPDLERIKHSADPHFALAIARIECHYFVNSCFLEPGQLLENMDKIAHIPGHIVHGRYDMITTPSVAWKLQEAWPKAQLTFIRDAGHSSSEPGIVDGLVRATQEVAREFAELSR